MTGHVLSCSRCGESDGFYRKGYWCDAMTMYNHFDVTFGPQSGGVGALCYIPENIDLNAQDHVRTNGSHLSSSPSLKNRRTIFTSYYRPIVVRADFILSPHYII
jgi:hypothetical protein